MNKAFCYVLILLISWCITSCSEDACDGGRQDIQCFEDLGCINAALSVSLESTKEFELIRDQETFATIVTSPCDIDIDWLNYDLIIGNEPLPNGLAKIDKSILMDCINNQLNLDIFITLNETAIAPIVTWQALIPKLRDNETLFVTVKVVNL